MPVCPACGSDVAPEQTECPSCHLSSDLFEAMEAAADEGSDSDPAYLQTIAELLQSVGEEPPASPEGNPPGGPAVERPVPELPKVEPTQASPALRTPSGLPPLPPASSTEVRRAQVDEYRRLARELDLDVTTLDARAAAAELTDDAPALDGVRRELFVQVASALMVAFESELAQRNEIAQLLPTPSVDTELDAARSAIDTGALADGERRLSRARDELGRLEEAWATGRILVASCDLLSETIAELGGDPAPALGPSRAGRRRLAEGDTESAEHLLARGALALWAALEPRFFERLRRLRDGLVELRSTGADLGPGVADLRAVSEELRRRNFVGTIVAYRGLRDFLDSNRTPPDAGSGPSGPEGPRPPTER